MFLFVAMETDGSGGHSFNMFPHATVFTAAWPQRHNLLKIHSEVTMVHEHGTYIHVSLSDLEVNGANMTLDKVLWSLLKTLRAKKESGDTRPLRTLSIRMDNTCSSNKTWAMVQGLGCLTV